MSNEERTQIKFSAPDIDGSTVPQLITLEQELPIESSGERENGEKYISHKWMCASNQYFFASDTLDVMLKAIPNKVGKVIKIEKVPNPTGGFPFFQVNGMTKDQIAANVSLTNDSEANEQPANIQVDPFPQNNDVSTQPPSKDVTLESIDKKLDNIVSLLEGGLPF